MSVKNNAAKSDSKPTLPREEGPYYKTGSPERTNIVGPGTAGKKLVIEGYLYDRKGRPVAGAWLDFWHADGSGEYDNEGHNLRGHQYTDKDGHYRLETVRPKEYLFRAAHVHVKVQAGKDSPVLTTQLFFPGEEKNSTDPIFHSATLMEVEDTVDEYIAAFNFVVDKG